MGPRADLERHGINPLVESRGVGANLIDHPFMVISAALSGDAVRQAPETDHSRLSVLLRHTAGGSTEFNDMQLYLMPLTDLTCGPERRFLLNLRRGCRWLALFSGHARAASCLCEVPILWSSRISNSTTSTIPRTRAG